MNKNIALFCMIGVIAIGLMVIARMIILRIKKALRMGR